MTFVQKRYILLSILFAHYNVTRSPLRDEAVFATTDKQFSLLLDFFPPANCDFPRWTSTRVLNYRNLQSLITGTWNLLAASFPCPLRGYRTQFGADSHFRLQHSVFFYLYSLSLSFSYSAVVPAKGSSASAESSKTVNRPL